MTTPIVNLIQLKDLPSVIEDSPWHLITDAHVWSLYKDQMQELLGDINPIIVPRGDESKTLSHVEEILGTLLGRSLNRDHRLIGLGGGAVCDLTGFVSAVALRGIENILIPTTLLAQVDAAHGGKTAVNLAQGKNLCGSFKFAKAIVLEQFFLKTLSEADWNNGRAEAYKTALISGPEMYKQVLESDTYDTELLLKMAAVKNDIVNEDPFEKNVRAYLNLGHTAGHAIEAQKQHNHGECVAMGMRFVLRLGKRLKNLKQIELIENTDQWMQKNNLPMNPKEFSRDAFFNYMRVDKKQGNKGLKWIFIAEAGEMLTNNDVAVEDLIAILDELNW